ncbi:MAG: hypothetical protein ACRDY4_13110 [Acidimicrobiia bacterium]
MNSPFAPEALVAVRPTGGLCNRLRVISSFQVLARYTGRELRVCWGPSIGFSAEDLSELFDNQFARLSESEFEQLCADALCLHDVITPGWEGERVWQGDPVAGVREVLDANARPMVAYEGVFAVDGLVGPAAATQLPTSFRSDYLAELRMWRPVAPLRRVVDELAAGFDSGTVGVHARRGDAVIHHRLGRYFRQSSDAAFFARMDRLLHEDPGSTFFLATDSAETEARFRERYGSVLRTNSEKQFVDSLPSQPKENQRDAVVDLFTLARTGHVLGSCYSSFSRAAADLGDVPLEVVLAHPFRYRVRGKLLQGHRALRARARSLARRLGSGR